ncbi:MAG: orotate phosphoribosyltransferase [Bacteroidales bacterium]|nr:orotate phosphoribosyltransferase [Bacteroidales bacterium]
MKTREKLIAKHLLQINAIKLQPANPFTWASGWKSPIYCDNRKILSFPETRNFVRDSFVEIIREKYPQAQLIAGVATGAIAIGALVAQELNLPFVYVRSAAKGHGLENLVEGVVNKNDKTVVVEDLISTGGSSLKAVEALRNTEADVLGMTAIFTYGFQNAIDNFKEQNVELFTLGNYNALIEQALETGNIGENEVELLKKWRLNPAEWGK